MRAGRNNSHGVKEHAFGPKKKRAFDSSISYDTEGGVP